ncbi:MAG: M15 family metallopeptidase, partial [Prevotella sp.]|nr:M15 family metallopeptidase [Prevotella sp.]
MNKILLYIGLLLSVSLMRADVKDEMQSLREWKAGAVVSDKAIQSFGIDNCFGVDVISDAVFARMKGKSFKENSRISRSDLRYLRVLHVDNKGAINIGEMVCNQQIANDLVAIFRQLYEARYPIERMVLIDDYQADDETSMRANNTSCFNYRQVQGSNKLSKHAQGLAVDINTLYNPCVKRKANGTLSIQPSTAKKY